jgi:hypothetical protein
MPSVNRKRAEAKTEDMKVQAKEGASTSKNEGNDYRPGMALEIDICDDGATPVATATTVKKGRCGGTDHQRSNSKKCRYYKERSLPSGECVSFRVLLCCERILSIMCCLCFSMLESCSFVYDLNV